MNTENMNERQDAVMSGAPSVIIEDVQEADLSSVTITGTPGVPHTVTGLQVTAERIEVKLARLSAHLGAG